jgi:PAS domain S-box-containing protein
MDTMRKCELTDVDLRDRVPIVTAVMDAIEALIIVLDTKARVVLCNHRCQEATGYSFDEAKAMYLWDLLQPAELEEVKSVFQRLSAGQFPGKHENYWVTKDGSRRLIRWSNTAVLDASGSVKYIIGTGTDVTDFETDERVAQATRKAIRQDLSSCPCTNPLSVQDPKIPHSFW